MQILNYFLIFCLINLRDSFIFINKKFNKYNNFNIDMGYDYFIDKDLELYDKDKLFSIINLDHQKGYFFFSPLLDEDEEGYDNEFSIYLEDILEPRMEPILIYSNNSFKKLSFENKYKEIIDSHLNLYNKTLSDVTKIVKIENRYER
jgi:hypothetical protein